MTTCKFKYIALVYILIVQTSRLDASPGLDNPPPLQGKLSPSVQFLCDSYFDWRVQDSPEFATFIGFYDNSDELDDLSMEAFQNRYDTSLQFLASISDLLPTVTDHDDILNLKVLRNEVTTYVEGYSFKGFYMPLNYFEGLHTDFSRLLSWMPRITEADYYNMISRMEKVGGQVDQVITLMTAGVRDNVTNHHIAMKSIGDLLGVYIVTDATTSPLYQYFTDFPDSISNESIADIQEQAKEAILNHVSPSFKKLQDYVTTEYVPRSSIAVTSLPNGPEFYQRLIKFHTSTELTPEEIHAKGLEEVDRIEAQMREIIDQLGFNMTIANFSQMIKDDSSNYFQSPEDLMEEFRHIVYDRIQPKLPDAFINIPKTNLSVVGAESADGPTAFYLAGSLDGSRPGVFYVNLYNYDAQPKYEMLTLSLHEGNPGHHLQGSHNLEAVNTPSFRKVNEDRNYGYSPSRFPMNTFYIEGWGLYAESTGFDMDLFGDLYERYGHYSDEIFRACRLVIDTGIHAQGWSREESISYMYLHTAMTRVAVENEVDRYITWPGQALAYKLGQLKFKEFRDHSREELGDLFDVKQFHDVILNSYGPMDVVEEEVNKWIQDTLGDFY